VKLVGKPDAGNPHVRFDERESGNGVWHAASEAPRGNPDTELCRSLSQRATSRLYSRGGVVIAAEFEASVGATDAVWRMSVRASACVP